MPRRKSLPLVLLLSLAAAAAAATPAAAAAPAPESVETTAYEALRSHGLPIGIFPKGVKDFRLEKEEGEKKNGEGKRFEALLDGPCTASQIRYDRNVSGRIAFGEIAFLSGVSAQDLFLWFPVRAIRVDVPASGLIYLDVGVVQKQLPLSLFESPPDCDAAAAAAATAAGLHEGASFANLLSKINSGKLRYELDEDDDPRPAVSAL